MAIARMLACGIGAVAALAAAPAFAQTTLGEALDKGGRVLSAAETKALLSGAKVSGKGGTGVEFELDFSANGEFKGPIWLPNGANGMMWGTWAVNDSNHQICSEFTTRVGSGGRSDKTCAYYVKAGEEYFIAESDTDRAAQLQKRIVKK